MKTLFYGILTLFALALGAILIVPGEIDWNRYKAPIAEALRAVTGRPLTFAGDVRFTMLPRPTLSVADLEVAAAPGATEPRLLRLGRLDARVALAPLLSGRIEVESVVLERPELVLETLPDGRRGWAAAGAATTPAPSAVRLEDVEIRDGSVLWRDGATGSERRLTGIRARLSAASLAGPFELRGEAVVDGVAVTVEGASGTVGDGSATPVRLTLGLAEAGSRLRFAGLVAGGAEPRLQGDLRADLAHPAAALTTLGVLTGPAPAALGQALTVHGALDATARSVSLTGLDAQWGEATVTGGARLTPGANPSLDLKLTTGRLDLEPWLDGWTLAAWRLPATLAVRLELSADALGLRQGLLRQAGLSARLADGVLAVERLALRGPGGSDLVAAGTVRLDQGRPVVDASLEATADNLRMPLDWLGLDSHLVAPDRLRRASLSLHARGGRDDLEVTGVDLRLDTSRATGGASYHNHGRPILGLRLDVDHLDLDAYRGDGGPPTLSDLAALVERGDGAVAARFGHVVVGGRALRGLDLDVSAQGGALTVRSARVAEVAGIAASLEGRIGGLTPLRAIDLTVGAETAALTTVERGLGLTLPAPLRRLGALKVTAHGTGDGAALALEVVAEGAGGRLEAAGPVAPGALRLAGPVKLRAVLPETGRVARLFVPDLVTEAEPGPTDLSLTLSEDGGRLRLSDLAGALAGVTLGGQADIDLGGARPLFDVRLKAGEIALDRVVPTAAPKGPPHRASLWPITQPARRHWSVEPLEFGWLTMADGQLAVDAEGVTSHGLRLGAPVLRATLAGGVLGLEQLDGAVMGGRFGATGRLAASAGGGEAAGSVTVVGARIDHGLFGGDIDITAGTLDLALDLKSAGDSEAALIGALSGGGSVAIANGRLQGIDLAALEQRANAPRRPQDVVAPLGTGGGEAAGDTAFDRLDGTVTLEAGVVSIPGARLSAASGDGEAQGLIDLPNRAINLATRFRVRHEPPLPAIGMTLTGGLDHPHRAIDTRELQGYLAQTLTGSVMRRLLPAAPGAVPAGELMRGLFHGPPAQP